MKMSREGKQGSIAKRCDLQQRALMEMPGGNDQRRFTCFTIDRLNTVSKL